MSQSRARIVVDAPAKLNLFLEVLAKREDGFHEIETLMVAVNIYDRLYVTSISEGQTKLTVTWASGMEAHAVRRDGLTAGSSLELLPKDTDNIVWKAVQGLRQRAGTNAGIAVQLIKRIPATAGLGGASSDAAAALVAANRLWGLGWSREQLISVAAEIGSDVPFFLSESARGVSAAICRGRGELIELVDDLPRLHFVVVKPPQGLSTPTVYRGCTVPAQPRSVGPLMAHLRGGDDRVGPLLFNRLQPAAQVLSPWIERLADWFKRADCIGHQMSGSGSAYFGICRSARQAKCVASRVRGAGLGQVFQCDSVSHRHRVAAIPH